MKLYEIKYKIGGRRMRGHFLLPLKDIERHVGPFKVVSETRIRRRGQYDEAFQKEWRALWAGSED